MTLAKPKRILIAVLVPVLIVIATLAIVLPLTLTKKKQKSNAKKSASETTVRHTWPWALVHDAAKKADSGEKNVSVALTYSFVCTGTPVGSGKSGTKSPMTLALQDHVDASVRFADFVADIELAFNQWSEAAAKAIPGLNLSFHNLGQEPCDGTERIPVLSGYERSPKIGDIRIGMYNMTSDQPQGTLAYAFLPTKVGSATLNGVTVDDERGDILFNAEVDWRRDNQLQSNMSGFSIMAVAAHEIGHSLGIGHLNDPSALMYPSIGNRFVMKQSLKKGIAGSLPDVAALRYALLT